MVNKLDFLYPLIICSTLITVSVITFRKSKHLEKAVGLSIATSTLIFGYALSTIEKEKPIFDFSYWLFVILMAILGYFTGVAYTRLKIAIDNRKKRKN